MIADTPIHPTEEALLAYAVERIDPTVAEHLATCGECAGFVAQVLRVRDHLQALPEEDVPLRVRRRVLTVSNRRVSGSGSWFAVFRGSSHALIGLGVVAAALFLYFLFVYLH